MWGPPKPPTTWPTIRDRKGDHGHTSIEMAYFCVMPPWASSTSKRKSPHAAGKTPKTLQWARMPQSANAAQFLLRSGLNIASTGRGRPAKYFDFGDNMVARCPALPHAMRINVRKGSDHEGINVHEEKEKALRALEHEMARFIHEAARANEMNDLLARRDAILKSLDSAKEINDLLAETDAALKSLHIAAAANLVCKAPRATEAAHFSLSNEADRQPQESDSAVLPLEDKLAAVRLEELTLRVTVRADVGNIAIRFSQHMGAGLGTNRGEYVLVRSARGSATLLQVDIDETCQADAIVSEDTARNLAVNAAECITIHRAKVEPIRHIALFPFGPGQTSNSDRGTIVTSYFAGRSRPAHKGDTFVAQAPSARRFVQFQVVEMKNAEGKEIIYGVVDEDTIYYWKDKVLQRDPSDPRHRQPMIPVPLDQFNTCMVMTDSGGASDEIASRASSDCIIGTELPPSDELPPPPYLDDPPSSAVFGCVAAPAEYHDKDRCNIVEAESDEIANLVKLVSMCHWDDGRAAMVREQRPSALTEAALLQLVDMCHWDDGRVAMVKALNLSAVSARVRARLVEMCLWDEGRKNMSRVLSTTG
ncbi:hypothetical protein PWT90_07311 [Aphanocladium album]|nr:hypothetical protein PWT90_07311 [Aphanocladium album]